MRAPAGLFDGGDALVDDDTMRSNWALPWSDLMMTMFVLVATLFAAQAQHTRNAHKPEPQVQEKVVEAAPAEEPVATQERAAADTLTQVDVLARSRDAVRDADLKNVQIAELDDHSVQVRMQGAMFFAAGQAELRPEVITLLGNLAKVIKDTTYDVQVVGHTDEQEAAAGQSPGDWELSLARAGRVAHHLIEAGGIDPSRFMVVGRGKYHPLSANTDAASRALNRRVEIIITRNTGKAGEDEIR
ncbi:MAG: OmpA family protein [Rhodospirillales bacterium]